MTNEPTSQYSITRRYLWSVLIAVNVILIGVFLGIGKIIARNYVNYSLIYLLNMNDIGQVGHSGEARDRNWVEVI
jgi:nicotinamide riboside transporter PnuC